MTGMSRDAAHAAIVLILAHNRGVPTREEFNEIADDILDAIHYNPVAVWDEGYRQGRDDEAQALSHMFRRNPYLNPTEPP